MKNKDLDNKMNFNSVEEATTYLLNNLHGCFETKDIIDNDRILLPEWGITVIPFVTEIREQMANTGYYIISNDWDRMIYECSVAMGKDTKQALGMAQGSFIFGIMSAIGKMKLNENQGELETDFAGNAHNWKVYLGDIVGMGEVPHEIENDVYWKQLEDGIKKRIGNQKLCYVKIYGSNIGDGNYIGECRINDVQIDELSNIVEKMIRDWGTTGFGSHKQFIMLQQNEDTILDYPFTEGEILESTEKAMKLFEKCETDEEYEQFPEMLEQAVGDKDLAWELYTFIPEICAENAFEKIICPETIMMRIGNVDYKYYKTQFISYYTIVDGVFRTLNKGVLKDTDKVYREYISVSSLYSAICSARESGHDPENEEGMMICTMYMPEDDYIPR
ncbi:MAG: hypothetical protein IJA34_13895 [Lachnospiraceae bacterium]|nr:hypothetical protein [Lachnospiraceae bacterium]